MVGFAQWELKYLFYSPLDLHDNYQTTALKQHKVLGWAIRCSSASHNIHLVREYRSNFGTKSSTNYCKCENGTSASLAAPSGVQRHKVPQCKITTRTLNVSSVTANQEMPNSHPQFCVLKTRAWHCRGCLLPLSWALCPSAVPISPVIRWTALKTKILHSILTLELM